MAIACRTRFEPGPGNDFTIDYERHEPEKTLLHRIVREELEPFLARARSAGGPVAQFVEREIRAYLACGVLAHGFLRVHCDGCGHDRLVAFSCKGRGFCPSCGGRRMADTAAHLVDRVLPEAPVRQWVLTLPFSLRYRCAWNAPLTSEVLRCFLCAVFADLRRRAKRDLGLRKGVCGAVTFIQRFGSALNLTPHFHTLVLDGVYEGPASWPGRFHALDPPETDDVARVLAGTARRIRRRLESEAGGDDEDRLAEEDPLLALLGATSIRSQIATGPKAGAPWRRLGDRVDPIALLEEDGGLEPGAGIPPRCVRQGGLSLHADVAVPARDRRRLERLCRYVARPPLALDRLEALADGRLAVRLKTPWRDGTTHVLMERRELLERLAPLIPPPRAHQVRYHGVLAPCASGRDRVVPRPGERKTGRSAAARTGTPEHGRHESNPGAPSPQPAADVTSAGRVERDAMAAEAESLRSAGRQLPASSQPTADTGDDFDETCCKRPEPRPHRTAWADLLQRVFEVDALRCPACGGRMRILSAITEPEVARRILDCLGMSSRAPPLPETETEATPEPGFEASTPELPWDDGPGFNFDQSPPGDR